MRKEHLLREIQHRVKNNLAVISSLFYYQRVETTDPVVARVFQDGQDRTRSMAMVHELLYLDGDLSRIDFGDYLGQLATHLSQTHGWLAPRSSPPTPFGSASMRPFRADSS